MHRGVIQTQWLVLSVYVIRLTIAEFGPRYSTCPNKDLVGVISLTKRVKRGPSWNRPKAGLGNTGVMSRV